MLILQFHNCARCARPWGCSDEHVYNLREGRRGERRGSVGTKVKWDNQGSKDLERWAVITLQVLLGVEERGKQCLNRRD